MNIKNIINEEIENFDWNKKDVAGKSIIPKEFVLHSSPTKNRKGILNNGLQLKYGDNYTGWVGRNKNAIPAIFATNGDINSVTGGLTNYPDDIWSINTYKINNKWYIDNHFSTLTKYGYNNPHIVTFENIPSNALTLIHKGNT